MKQVGTGKTSITYTYSVIWKEVNTLVLVENVYVSDMMLLRQRILHGLHDGIAIYKSLSHTSTGIQ